jgi:hypothetical protein
MMSEELLPQLQPASEGIMGQCGSLLRSSPRWRFLFIAASVFTAATIALPVATIDRCDINMNALAPEPVFFRGKVVGFLTPAQAEVVTQRVKPLVNGEVSPLYRENTRVAIERPGQSGAPPDTVLVPNGMRINIGDWVEYAARHRDTNFACHYIPQIITRVVPSF